MLISSPLCFPLTRYSLVPYVGIEGTKYELDVKEGMDIADGVVLVTGASGGQQGKTGRNVSEEQLRALGAEVLEGDFLDIRSVQRAVQGVSSIYFAYPVQDGLLDATAA